MGDFDTGPKPWREELKELLMCFFVWLPVCAALFVVFCLVHFGIYWIWGQFCYLMIDLLKPYT